MRIACVLFFLLISLLTCTLILGFWVPKAGWGISCLNNVRSIYVMVTTSIHNDTLHFIPHNVRWLQGKQNTCIHGTLLPVFILYRFHFLLPIILLASFKINMAEYFVCVVYVCVCVCVTCLSILVGNVYREMVWWC